MEGSWLENAAGVSSTGFFRLAHCWVLRQQDRRIQTFTGLEGHGFVLFLIVPAQVQDFHGEYVVVAGCDGVVV